MLYTYYEVKLVRVQTVIGIIVSILGIIGYIVKISADYSKLKTKLEIAEQRIAETKAIIEKESGENSQKFVELFASRNKTNEALVELSTTLKIISSNIDKQFENLDKKIDTLSKK